MSIEPSVSSANACKLRETSGAMNENGQLQTFPQVRLNIYSDLVSLKMLQLPVNSGYSNTIYI